MRISYREKKLLIFYEYKLGKNTKETAYNINRIIGLRTVCKKTVDRWFVKFEKNQLNFDDASRPGRPKTIDRKRIKKLIEEDRSLSSREIAKQLNCNHTTILKILHQLEKIIKKQLKFLTNYHQNS